MNHDIVFGGFYLLPSKPLKLDTKSNHQKVSSQNYETLKKNLLPFHNINLPVFHAANFTSCFEKLTSVFIQKVKKTCWYLRQVSKLIDHISPSLHKVRKGTG